MDTVIPSSKHIWNFSIVGGVKRVNFESGRDLIELENLDQKLWTALSCPLNGLEIDPQTLALIDADKNGQIRVKDILVAVEWITNVLKNPNDLFKQESQLPLAAINTETEQGRILLASAKIILKNLKREDDTFISTEDTSDPTLIFAATPFNGDGIVTEDSTSDFLIQQLINHMLNCYEGIADRGGKKGVSQEVVDAFFEQCNLYDQWLSKAENNAEVYLPFGKNTDVAFQVFNELKTKIDDFFMRCKLANFDPKTGDLLNSLQLKIEAISATDLMLALDEVKGFPIAKTNQEHLLPLVGTGINPAWKNQMEQLRQLIVEPIFPSKEALNENDWISIQLKFQPYQEWLNEKLGVVVESLGLDYIREILKMNAQAIINDLIEKDKALEQEANNIILVDQMVRYYRDIFALLKNFVTFYDFYSHNAKAIFQAGTLYIDQRSCELCIKVQNMEKHDAIASLSGLFLVYCECRSKQDGETMIIAAAITNGDIDNLEVGRNALFYDRNGLDWDATVIKIIDNPISIQQAFWSPYRRVSKFIGNQVNKFASTQDSKVQEKSTSSIEKANAQAEESLEKSTAASSTAASTAAVPVKKVEKVAVAPAAAAPAPPPTPFDVGKFVGIFAAISLALGALGTAVASIVSGFLALEWWKIPIAIAGILMAISGPSMILAYIKLRKRNLAPLLDANGWAINANVIINIPFGNALTSLADLPEGAKIHLNDPFTQKKRPFLLIIIVSALVIGGILFLLWKYGLIHIRF